MAASLVAAKQQLRSRMKQRLSALSHDAIAAQSTPSGPRPCSPSPAHPPHVGRAVFDALVAWKPYRDATRVSIFLSMPAAEVQTDAIVRHALACGKQVFVPYLHRPPPGSADAPARRMDMVSLAGLADYESLRPDRWGIPSVDPATVDRRRRVLAGSAHLDLMLVPGVAFDSDEAGRIRRLGHGKGFYDLFLNTYLARDGPPLLLYGLALAEQLLAPDEGERVPVGVHDRNLHGLILGSGQLRESPDAAVA